MDDSSALSTREAVPQPNSVGSLISDKGGVPIIMKRAAADDSVFCLFTGSYPDQFEITGQFLFEAFKVNQTS